MCMRIFVCAIVVLAVIVGVLALLLQREQLITLTMFRDFFDIALPILGFGALVKYLCTCNRYCKSCHDHLEKKV